MTEQKFETMNNRMNELQIFNNPEFGSIRSIVIDSEPWFIGKDVAEILGYRDTSDALKRHVDQDDKLSRRFTDSGQGRDMYIINESGLYNLILSSKLPSAKRFKGWVTSEVLPSIRKHGLYAVDEVLDNPDMLIGALQALKEERQRNEILREQNETQKQQLIEMKPKACYYDVVLNCPDLVSVTTIAKDYGGSGRWLNSYLSDHGIQYKQGDKWFLYQKYAGMGLTGSKTHTVPGSEGEIRSRVHTYWTQKGRLFIYDLLKADGILPVMERMDTE